MLFSSFLRQRSDRTPPIEWEFHAFAKAVASSRLEDRSTNKANFRQGNKKGKCFARKELW